MMETPFPIYSLRGVLIMKYDGIVRNIDDKTHEEIIADIGGVPGDDELAFCVCVRCGRCWRCYDTFTKGVVLMSNCGHCNFPRIAKGNIRKQALKDILCICDEDMGRGGEGEAFQRIADKAKQALGIRISRDQTRLAVGDFVSD